MRFTAPNKRKRRQNDDRNTFIYSNRSNYDYRNKNRKSFCRKMSKLFGTLVLYDVENLKTPLTGRNGKYLMPRVDLVDVDESIKRIFDDIHYNSIAFVKSYYHKDKRYEKNSRFFSFLRIKGFEVIEKMTKNLKNLVTSKGKKLVYTYEECDMDSSIIYSLLTYGPKYNRVILLSGDDDMYDSLLVLQEKYNTEIIVISHKENLSEKLKQFRYIYLHELLERQMSKKEKE